MMHSIPHILASDDGAIFKLVFWGVIILIVAIAKVVKFIGKMVSPNSALPAAPTPPAMRAQPQPLPATAGAIPLPPLPAKAAKAKRKVARKAPAIPVTVGPMMGVVSAIQQARSTAVAPPVARPTRSSGKGWLTARVIREQFAMAEALKPPLSLKRN